ncbi:hypothetical protein CPI84_07695 [Erwinia pyrifoliae]|nr:hypothetical protein CPI84_07695 [Erwinia pyrifoliae]
MIAGWTQTIVTATEAAAGLNGGIMHTAQPGAPCLNGTLSQPCYENTRPLPLLTLDESRET